MRILVLDDMEVRHDGFKCRYAGHDISHAYDVESAIFCLKYKDKYELVCLDHDLSFQHYEGSVHGEGTGFEVAKFISEMPKEDLPTQVIIHSWNPVGAERMYKQLQGLGMFISKQPA